MGRLTRDLPKSMLPFGGKPLLAWQIEALRRLDVRDITVVTGYRAEVIETLDVTCRHNHRFLETNMVASLMTARDLFDDDLLISYADVLVADSLMARVVDYQGFIGVAVDSDWQRYWQARYGRVDFDTESLSLDTNGFIRELGVPDASPELIDGRYVGLLKFSRDAVRRLVQVHEAEKESYAGGTWRNSKNFACGYMTDLLQALIDHGEKVEAVITQGGWLEFDSAEDYQIHKDWLAAGLLGDYLTLKGLV